MNLKLILSTILFFFILLQVSGQSISIDSLLAEDANLKHKPQELIKVKSAIISQDPYNYKALHERGEAYHKLWLSSHKEDENAFRMALQDFTKAISVDDKFHQAYFSRSILYLQAKELDLSLKDISRAVLLDINNPDYYQWRGEVYQRMKNYNLADANFDIAIKILRRKFYNADKRTVLIELYKAKAYNLTKAGEYKKAIKAINKAIDFGIRWESILYKGNIYAEMGEYKKALKMYNYITKRTAAYLPVYLHRGKVLYALNQKDQAIADWIRMIEGGLDVDLKNTSIKPGF